MTLLERLKQEYKDKLTDDCIRILSKHEYYIDLNIIDAQIVCYDLTKRSLELNTLIELFYEVKEMKEVLIEIVAEYDRTLDSTIFPDKEIERMREIIKEL
jgi:tRNA C32,U32 (ribose-2'-O)-methylase TrmJ